MLREELSDSDTDNESEANSESEEEFITPPESPVMPELLSDSDSEVDWDNIHKYDDSTSPDSGISTPDTSQDVTNDEFPDDITDVELSYIMDNYDTEIELSGVRRGMSGEECPDLLDFSKTSNRSPTPIPDFSISPVSRPVSPE